jgi:hypothetical protein
MYRPAESMAGNASTTMLAFSSLSRGVPAPEPLEHPAASITTATADATSTFRDFIFAPSGIAASRATRDGLGEHRDRQRPPNASRSIMGFCTVRHLPNGMTYPNQVSLCYRN